MVKVDIDSLKATVISLQPIVIIILIFAVLALGIYISLKNTHDDRNNPLVTRSTQIAGYIIIGVGSAILLGGLFTLMRQS